VPAVFCIDRHPVSTNPTWITRRLRALSARNSMRSTIFAGGSVCAIDSWVNSD
jgi:hypothetical protein